ncbi:MAG: hydrogenase formation protein HypD [Thermodesulfobacteriota bacterium]
MGIKYMQEYRDPEIAGAIAEKIRRTSKRPVRLMEVCGTHTVSIFRNGIRGLLPRTITLLSGPGCPVCVTTQQEIDAFIRMAGMDDVIIATFGDLMRVPGTLSSLQKERAEGRDIRMVYAAGDALKIAGDNPRRKVVFLGVGFETTAPTIAATLLAAREMRIGNFFVFSAHKCVPPALFALMQSPGVRIDGFILPGHVSVIIGTRGYLPFFQKYQTPCAVAGFEPVDILQAVYSLVRQIESGTPELANEYRRVVAADGNARARRIMQDVFEVRDAAWRGIGVIPASGLKLREAFAGLDAEKVLAVEVPESTEPRGCRCGEVLTGRMTPPECPLYRTVCTPMAPVGPCMVSGEGTCAAYYRYQRI